jgi:hypothetical protein
MNRGAPLNPFSACFHQPGEVPYRFFGNESPESLWRRFVKAGRRGEIVGPHGTGKTTLLRTLEPVAQAAGEAVRTVTLHNGQRWPWELLGPRAFRMPEDVSLFKRTALSSVDRPPAVGIRQDPPTLLRTSSLSRGRRTLFLDGAEQLAPAVWFALRFWTRAAGIGLLATSHRSLGLPALCTTSVDDEAALWVTRTVLAKNAHAPCLVGAESVTDALAIKKGNLREALFHLYDVYEDRWKIHSAAAASGPVRRCSGCERP